MKSNRTANDELLSIRTTGYAAGRVIGSRHIMAV